MAPARAANSDSAERMIAALAGGTYCWPIACRVKAIEVDITPVYRISIQPEEIASQVGCSRPSMPAKDSTAVAAKQAADMVMGMPVSCTSGASTAICTAHDMAHSTS